jgi:hypothetical protein
VIQQENVMIKTIILILALSMIAMCLMPQANKSLPGSQLTQEVMYENHIEGNEALVKYMLYFTSAGYTSITVTYLGGSDELPIYGMSGAKLSKQQ